MSLPQLAVIEYPGAVVDMDRATQTLQYIPPVHIMYIYPNAVTRVSETGREGEDAAWTQSPRHRGPSHCWHLHAGQGQGSPPRPSHPGSEWNQKGRSTGTHWCRQQARPLPQYERNEYIYVKDGVEMAEYGYDVQVPEDWASLANGICNLDCTTTHIYIHISFGR